MRRVILGALLAGALALPAEADTLKLAVGQRGNWDTSVAELGQEAGIFKKHGLELEILYTSGGGETQQAVLSRSVDVGVAAGTLGVVGAASKGAPVRIIGAETTGAADHNPGQKVLGAPPFFQFEPHQPEQCDWKPDVLLDITSVWDKKRAAIECMAGQEHLWDYYTRVAQQRGAQAARNSDKSIKYGEGYVAVFPHVVESLA